MALTPTNNPWHIDVAPIAGQLVLGDTNPGSIQWVSASQSVSEGAGTVTLTAERSGGSDGAVGASYATSDGSATAGSDYTADSGTLSWADGESGQKSVTISILQDSTDEGDETFDVTLSSPTGGATLGGTTTQTVTITDDDSSGGDSGGTSALSWSASSGLSHGNELTVQTDGTHSFGTKTQAAPCHWQMGSDVRINGTQVTAEAIGDQPDTTSIWTGAKGGGGEVPPVVSGDYLRHARVDRAYLMKGASMLENSQGLDAIGSTEGEQLYFAHRLYPGCKYYSTRIYSITNVSGTFQEGTDRTRGEKITIDASAQTGNTGEAYITYISPNDYVTFEQIDDLGDDTALAGATITGQTSGATAELGTYQTTPHSVKAVRTWQEIGGEGIRFTYSHLSGGWLFYGQRDSSGTQTHSESEYDNGDGAPSTNPEQWHLFEIMIDASGSTGTAWIFVDGVQRHKFTNLDLTHYDPDVGNRIGQWGLDTPGVNIPYEEVGFMAVGGEIYADNDIRRLYVCDAATVANSTELEVQRPTAWSDTSITLALNQGAFADLSGKYLAMMDGDTVVFEGLAL